MRYGCLAVGLCSVVLPALVLGQPERPGQDDALPLSVPDGSRLTRDDNGQVVKVYLPGLDPDTKAGDADMVLLDKLTQESQEASRAVPRRGEDPRRASGSFGGTNPSENDRPPRHEGDRFGY